MVFKYYSNNTPLYFSMEYNFSIKLNISCRFFLFFFVFDFPFFFSLLSVPFTSIPAHSLSSYFFSPSIRRPCPCLQSFSCFSCLSLFLFDLFFSCFFFFLLFLFLFNFLLQPFSFCTSSTLFIYSFST